jgi:holo-[acyl-carrier protein] synthase
MNDGAQAMLEEREDEPVSMGVDIVEIERMKAILERSPAFPKRAFSEAEQAYCNKMAQPAAHYATRFAAKEAVLKALGCGFNGVGLRDVEVVVNAKGKPRVKLYRKAAAVAMERGVRSIPISLSYTHTDAVACALAITDEGRVPPAKEDPTAVLTRKFKEARAMLDELDNRGDESQPEEER